MGNGSSSVQSGSSSVQSANTNAANFKVVCLINFFPHRDVVLTLTTPRDIPHPPVDIDEFKSFILRRIKRQWCDSAPTIDYLLDEIEIGLESVDELAHRGTGRGEDFVDVTFARVLPCFRKFAPENFSFIDSRAE
ncbi:unnamed protein product [Vitrella brassicaformis CCMP3155]|uniref:Uncharacterized protein n=1 Tax=Vitrella brassicaformis (strain CCMP3155) TaxID=1169540 RepID=A0A0G4G6E0_VITBC|nr:unnamed protein product [Vitrella brassicaformis CCMP3155]|eukprot:CEM24030.1 unnamed protein product [Vitrella brassicaformis CCMP3155]